MTVPGALGRAFGAAVGAVALMLARPLIWLIHRPTDRGEASW